MMKLEKELEEATEDLAKLSLKTNMPIIQENGQLRYGPPIGEQTVPLKGSEVFVGKLPRRDCTLTDIVPIFEKVGKIYQVRMMMDFSGSNKGYCFVQYYNPEDASKAVLDLDKYPIFPGRCIGVTKSADNCRLFVGRIPKEKSNEEIFDAIKEITDGVRNVICYASPKDPSRNRGYAFVEYETHSQAAIARRKLLSRTIQIWEDVDCIVNWAIPEVEVDTSILNNVKILYVRNLLMQTTEETLRGIFNAAATNNATSNGTMTTEPVVEKVKKLMDYAFVHFCSREAAEIALNNLNGTKIEGSVVQVTWSKPVDRNTYHARKANHRAIHSQNQIFGGGFRMNTNSISYQNQNYYLSINSICNPYVQNYCPPSGYRNSRVTNFSGPHTNFYQNNLVPNCFNQPYYEAKAQSLLGPGGFQNFDGFSPLLSTSLYN